jgi:hypothetical protein
MATLPQVREALEGLSRALPQVRTVALYGGPALLIFGVHIDQFVIEVTPRLGQAEPDGGSPAATPPQHTSIHRIAHSS